MHNEEQFLKARTKQESCGQPSIGGMGADLCGASREPTVKEILMHRADALRAEALRLETLARQYPEGSMTREAEETLRNLVVGNLYR